MPVVDRGGIVWFTGLPCAGKTALARGLAVRLAGLRRYELFDDDEVHELLGAELAGTREERDVVLHRLARVARLIAKHGVLSIVAAVVPNAATRAALKQRSEAAGHPFVEVYVNVPLEAAIARDAQGLYRRARAGELPSLPGVTEPYEPPTEPVIEVMPDRETQNQSEQKILRVLTRLGLA